MKINDESSSCCDSCSAPIEGLNSAVAISIRKGAKAVTRSFQFCDYDCFLRWALKPANKKAIARTIEILSDRLDN